MELYKSKYSDKKNLEDQDETMNHLVLLEIPEMIEIQDSRDR